MAGPLTFFRPFRHETVHSLLLLQSAPIDLTLRVASRLRRLFPDCPIDVVVREDDRAAVVDHGFARVMAVRWEDRHAVVKQLRKQRYDTVVVPTGYRGSDYLRVLPFLLKTRSILIFNDNLDYFPLHAGRLTALAHHVSGQPSAGALLRWIGGRLLFVPLVTMILVAGTLRLELRAARLRRRA